MKIFVTSLALAVTVIGSMPTYAITNKELHTLPGKEIGTYTHANLSMLIYMLAKGGNKPAATCVDKWSSDGNRATDAIYAATKNYPDHPPEAIVFALARKKCFPKK